MALHGWAFQVATREVLINIGLTKVVLIFPQFNN